MSRTARWLIPPPVALSCLLAVPTHVPAQAPGYQGPNAAQIRAEYRAEILGLIDDAMAVWESAWAGDDLDALAALYVEEAVIFPFRGNPIRGRAAIRVWLEEILAAHGSAEATLQDFDVSGGMAMAYSHYRIQVRDGDRVTGEVSGDLITIHIQRGHRWRIRSQVFRPH